MTIAMLRAPTDGVNGSAENTGVTRNAAYVPSVSFSTITSGTFAVTPTTRSMPFSIPFCASCFLPSTVIAKLPIAWPPSE
jgi:hypothetical protein